MTDQPQPANERGTDNPFLEPRPAPSQAAWQPASWTPPASMEPLPAASMPPADPDHRAPWIEPSRAGATPVGDHRTGSSTFKTAFAAAAMSALLTASLAFAVVKATTPSPAVTTPPGGAVADATPAASATTPQPSATASPPPATTVATGPASGSVVTATAKAIGSVVTITITGTATGRRGQSFQETGVGSGIIFDSRGWILTNAHVVSGADSVTVQLADGRQLTGQVYGLASGTDLAVVKVDAGGLPVASIGDSSALALGDTVIAIGTPLGEYPGSVTTGVVSGLDRSITLDSGTLDGLIQTDAAVNPGNSGGPLLDTTGQVIGVDTATSGIAQGISFAIPISAARPIMAEALAGQPIN